MISLQITHHAQQRQSQRGFSRTNLALIYLFGETIGDQELLMTNREIDILTKELKSHLQRLDKLRNRKLVVDGSTIITGYCLNKKAKRHCRMRMRSAV